MTSATIRDHLDVSIPPAPVLITIKFCTSTPDLVDVNPPATSALKLCVSGTGIRPAPVVIDRADGGRRGGVAAVAPVFGLDPVVPVAVLGAERVTPAKQKHIKI